MNLPLELKKLEGSTRPLTFLVNSGLRDWLPTIRAYYPGGSGEELRNGNGNLDFITYRLAASDTPRKAAVNTEQGLRRTITQLERPEPVASAIDPIVAYRNAAQLGGDRRYDAVWTGQLVTEQPGRYELEVLTTGEAQLSVGGRQLIQQAAQGDRSWKTTVDLADRQSIELRYGYRGGPGVIELYWRAPGKERELIPPGALQAP
jgi:hypothetical protein